MSNIEGMFHWSFFLTENNIHKRLFNLFVLMDSPIWYVAVSMGWFIVVPEVVILANSADSDEMTHLGLHC